MMARSPRSKALTERSSERTKSKSGSGNTTSSCRRCVPADTVGLAVLDGVGRNSEPFRESREAVRAELAQTDRAGGMILQHAHEGLARNEQHGARLDGVRGT